MRYYDYKGVKLSRLGMGCMRLPVCPDGSIDEKTVDEMVDYCMANGINYFDTAMPYHAGQSEIVVGKSLSRYPRESYYLADKYPGHQKASSYTPRETFEKQLKKCGVEYFDFYLFHNICENSWDTYTNEDYKIFETFVALKKEGRIKHLGFSTHARPECLKEILDRFGDEMEFCQIQLNYLDWSLQKAEEKVKMLNERGIAIWVMEPVRGGRLAKLSDAQSAMLKAQRPDESEAAWSLRYIEDILGVSMILSGMSNMPQLEDNIKTFSTGGPLSEQERALLEQMAEDMKKSIPCTSCHYCVDGCPQGLDIPMLMHQYSDIRFDPKAGQTVFMLMQSLPQDAQPHNCIGCGACAEICPQGIEIPKLMHEFAEYLDTQPRWNDICKAREEIENKIKI